MKRYANLLHKLTAAAVDFDTEPVHGDGCKCCSPKSVVEENERRWAQKWKEIQKQRREDRKQQRLTGDGDWGLADKRWYHEYQAFEEMRWSFY